MYAHMDTHLIELAPDREGPLRDAGHLALSPGKLNLRPTFLYHLAYVLSSLRIWKN
jgi:hypothetical protein